MAGVRGEQLAEMINPPSPPALQDGQDVTCRHGDFTISAPYATTVTDDASGSWWLTARLRPPSEPKKGSARPS